MDPLVFQGVTCGAAVLAAACAIFVAMRQGKWRESDEAKALIARLTKVESDNQLTEMRLIGLPTQTDIAGLRAEIRTVEVIVEQTQKGADRVERAVERIEAYMMEHPR